MSTHACVHCVTTYNRSNEIRYTFFAQLFIEKLPLSTYTWHDI